MARREGKGTSLAKGPVAILGMASLAFGVLGLILGGNSFSGLSIPSGTMNGESFLGIEGNGWTNLLFIIAGALLLFGAPLHWGAKTMGIIVGLALGAASVIALVDGEDVLGIFAANGLTKLVWGAGSVALLLLSLLPRVGGKKRDATADRQRTGRDRDLDAPRDRDAPRARAGGSSGERTLDAPPRRFERESAGEREPVRTRSEEVPAPDEGPGSRGATGGDDGYADRQDAASDEGPSGSRRVVAPADGDGPGDHGRNGR